MRRSSPKTGQWADPYTHQAKKEHFPARSVYKLQEIQRRYRLVRNGHRILDLGCSPGSWLLYAAGLVGNQGQVIGVDLNPVTIRPPRNVRVLIADVFVLAEDARSRLEGGFNGVLSDMAPSTSGIKHVDSARSLSLSQAAFSVARQVVGAGGYFVCKVFQGADFDGFAAAVKTEFHRFGAFKPQSSRKASKEIYVIGRDRKEAGGGYVRS